MNETVPVFFMAISCVSGCPLSRGLSETGACSSTTQCCICDQLTTKLTEHFGYTTFRPGQRSAVLSILHGNDVFVRMATGAGKSLCMFLPPLVASETSLAVVISPLVSLMNDQVF